MLNTVGLSLCEHPFFVHNGTQPVKKDTWLDYFQFNKLRVALGPLECITRDALFNPFLSPKQVGVLKSLGLTLSFTSDNRPTLLAKDNLDFIKILRDMGFFNVFNTNSGTYKVQLSQVIMFVNLGINWIHNGLVLPGNLYNIHHLNQDVCDNRLINLDVLPVDIHSFITSLQVGKHNIPTNLYSKDYLLTIFSKAPLTTKTGGIVQGMTQWISRLSQVIRMTLIASTSFCVKHMCVLKQSLSTIPVSSDLLAMFGLLDDLEGSYEVVPGLVGKVGSFLKGKSIPTLTSIQLSIKSWWKTFKDYLGASNVIPMFGGSQMHCA